MSCDQRPVPCALVDEDAPRIFPSHERFDLADSRPGLRGGTTNGLLVTSEMNGDGCDVGRLGEGIGIIGRAALRMGVNPDWRLVNIRRTRGVRPPPSSVGMLSAVKTCGGTGSQVSKSSGARRFFPTIEDGDGASASSRLRTGTGSEGEDACDCGRKLNEAGLELSAGADDELGKTLGGAEKAGRLMLVDIEGMPPAASVVALRPVTAGR